LQEEATYINTLYQAEDLSLYIGTNGSGVVVYNAKDSTFKHYHKDNCALISNNIYTILPESDGHILMSTENGISCFHPAEKIFHNWTKEQGLMSSCFSASSGTLRKNKGFVFGSTDGAIEFPEGTRLPKYIYSPMILSDFQIFYQTVFPGSMNSPLKENINQTDRLKLKYNQNTFSLNISSINYDAPDNVTFYWKLEGFYDDWNRLSEEGHLRFTNLASGDYKLCIRAVSKEEPYLYFEERSIDISIARPVWFSFWAIACYVLLAALMFITGFRIIALRKQKKISDEKTRFFVNTAHDIRTPLTLIKAPLEEMLENKTLNEAETNNMHMALRNVNSLLHMTTNLINFERAEVYSSHLYIAEYELNTYIKEIYNIFRTYAAIKHISFRYESNFSYMNVWFDKEKMDSILKNVISNALKYTPEKGDILISVYDIGNTWRLEIKDNGIGIPAKEQRKLFKMHFRGTNAINSKTTGSGTGLMLVRKLVNLHNGKIHIESTEHQGTTIRITLPKDKEQFKHFTLAIKEKKSAYELDVPITPSERTDSFLTEDKDKLQRILIVEDNDELRNYLLQSFSPNYNVQVCGNGKEALAIVKQFWPELILSDIMMPEMRGDELCTAIKSDIETSHIPILLLTALGDEKNILEGLQIGADEYIVKPFSINILKASIANLLANRALLRKKYADLEINAAEEEPPTATCSNSLDWIFMSNVKKNIEDNIDNPDFTVDTLCSLLNMSRTSFYNKLKALTAQAPADFVRNIRLKHAANLLKEGKYSITEVAERTGFCDGKYFREVFKKYFNVSPSQYAKGDTPRSPKGEGE
jgi:signal transduction histidine kinase/AraC-like DNA-binding protein/AmiR/NasT family two-component response regulator